jgi:hypothetical protein
VACGAAGPSTGVGAGALYRPCPSLLRSRRLIACRPHYTATWI